MKIVVMAMKIMRGFSKFMKIEDIAAMVRYVWREGMW